MISGNSITMYRGIKYIIVIYFKTASDSTNYIKFSTNATLPESVYYSTNTG